MENKPVYALAISPHPFDNEWGVAGTIARWTKEGKDVVYVICTNGDKGSSDTNVKAEDLAKAREQEQLEAARILGVREVIFLGYPDLELEYTPEFRKELLRLLLLYRPEIVVTCDPYHMLYMSNPDHRVTGRAVLDAIWPCALAPNTYRDLLDQGLQPHKVKQILLWAAGQPNCKYDITGTFDTKMAAIRCHKTQVSVLPPGWFERLVERNKAAAEGETYELAEAFQKIEVLQRL
jgi:LmbE family N-acetylglucosaminyl deacetylase